RATGKLSEHDYQALHAKYTEEALAALREGAPPAVRRAPAIAGEVQRAAHRVPPSCPEHGPRPEAGAVYCSACGRRGVGRGEGSPGSCSGWGAPLEADARYCARCGVSVAA